MTLIRLTTESTTMLTVNPVSKYRRRRYNKWLQKSQRLAQMRVAKAKKHQFMIESGLIDEPEPKMQRYYKFEFGVRDKITGETEWHDLVSIRHASKALGLILKFI